MKSKILIIIVILIILGGIIFWFYQKNSSTPVACTQDVKLCPDGSYVSRVPPDCNFASCPGEEEPSQIFHRKVLLYYYNPDLDKDESDNIKCSRDGLVAIEREIPVSETPIKDTINLLLKGRKNLTQIEIEKGIGSEYPLDDFSLTEANLEEDGNLILKFDDPFNKTSGGSCRVGILWFQIEATAKQFNEVQEVQFLPEELFQP